MISTDRKREDDKEQETARKRERERGNKQRRHRLFSRNVKIIVTLILDTVKNCVIHRNVCKQQLDKMQWELQTYICIHTYIHIAKLE